MRKKFKKYLRRSSKLIRTFRFWESVGIATAIIAFGITAFFSSLQYQEILEAKEMRALQTLSSDTAISSLKVKSLEYLAKRGVILDGIDLSCKSLKEDPRNVLECKRGKNHLKGLDLSYKNIGKKVSLRYANFTGANLENANFQGVDLSGSDFSNANLRNVNFQNTVILEATFYGADLFFTNFQNSNLAYSKFSKNLSLKTDFRNSNLFSVLFYQIPLDNAYFQGSNLSNAVFDSVQLGFYKDKYSDLSPASFDDAYLEMTRFSNLMFADKAQFENAWVFDNDEELFLPKFPREFGNIRSIIKFCDFKDIRSKSKEEKEAILQDVNIIKKYCKNGN